MIIRYQPREPLIAGFFGYAPLIQASLLLLVLGRLDGPVRLVRVHAWTQRGKQIDQAYREALGRGQRLRESDLRDQPHEDVEPLAAARSTRSCGGCCARPRRPRTRVLPVRAGRFCATASRILKCSAIFRVT